MAVLADQFKRPKEVFTKSLLHTSDECTKLQRRRPANGTMNVRTSLPMMQRTVEPRRSCVCRCFHLLCFSGAPVGNEASGELTVFVLSMTS
jgi:hypothetical protein